MGVRANSDSGLMLELLTIWGPSSNTGPEVRKLTLSFYSKFFSKLIIFF